MCLEVELVPNVDCEQRHKVSAQGQVGSISGCRAAVGGCKSVLLGTSVTGQSSGAVGSCEYEEEGS